MNNSVLNVFNLKKEFSVHFQGQNLKLIAVNDLSFNLYSNETLAIVGESGCGKSTVAKILMGLHEPTEGTIEYGENTYSNGKVLPHIDDIQMIFQDPYNSLNPRKKAWEIIASPLLIKKVNRKEAQQKAIEAMIKVGLRPDQANNYPHMFSGGQRQRIGIARAIIKSPKILICDEPVSALDVSIQAQILNLLLELQREMGLSCLFISHDLSVVKHISDRVVVMYLGSVVEYGPIEQVFNYPQHPYTKLLIESVPSLHQKEIDRVSNTNSCELPSPLNLPQGCLFQSRCFYCQEKCKTERPAIQETLERGVSCFFPL
ncbi:MAG: ATP-binding cassette domain-containing protein [Halobacteriovoraceae bacterium]|nr:ATP-binding cassette domain-containing protein [Halobacteriovoraceae bacterium]